MRSPTPTAKIRQPNTKGTKLDDRRPKLARFDKTQFINTVEGPSNLVVIFCIIASMCFSGLVVDEIQAPPFCSSSNDQGRECTRCPEFATCRSGTPVCSDPFINRYNFCVIPDSDEDKALKYLPQVRGLTEPKLPKLASKIGVSLSVLKIAYMYSRKEVLGGFKTADSFLYLVVAIASWIGTFLVIYIQMRYKKEHDYTVKAFLYVEKKPPTKYTIGHLCQEIDVVTDDKTKQRILKGLVQVPQIDVDLDAKTVFRRI